MPMFREYMMKQRMSIRARKDLWKSGFRPGNLSIQFSKTSPLRADVLVIRKGPRSVVVDYPFQDPLQIKQGIRQRLACIIHPFLHCSDEVGEAGFNISDGGEHSTYPFAFSSNRANDKLIPDYYQFRTQGFASLRAFVDTDGRPWKERNTVLRWRGADTGAGRFAYHDGIEQDPTVNQRIRLCKVAEQIDGTNCKIATPTRSERTSLYEKHGVIADFINEHDWINDRYALDIDGHTNTWSNFVARMHLGCCVLKVDSQFGYRQWYYDRIKPWVHYVPVKADMSDLAEKLDWVRAHDDEAEQIARNGQTFARTLTMHNNTRDAVETIETHYLGKVVTEFDRRAHDRRDA